jgi:hypothetical protein
MVVVRALALVLAIPSAALAQPSLALQGRLEAGDMVCANLCDRYGAVWDAGGSVRVRLRTNGFGGSVRATRTEGGRAPGAGTEVQLIARPGEPIFVEVEETSPQGGGLYQLDIEPPPSRYRLPANATAAPANGPPAFAPAQNVQRPMGPPPPGAGAPADPTRAVVEQMMRGFRSSGPLLVGRLEQVPALEFTAERGKCYRSAIVLAVGSRRRPAGPQSPAPAALVRMTLRTRRGPEAVTESPRSTDRVIAIEDDLCATENGTLELAFLDRFRADTVASPGIGPFTVQLFERPAAR